jgi:hypothetical protein
MLETQTMEARVNNERASVIYCSEMTQSPVWEQIYLELPNGDLSGIVPVV